MSFQLFVVYAKFARMFFIKFLTVIVHTSFPELMPWFLLGENSNKEKTSDSLFSKIIEQLLGAVAPLGLAMSLSLSGVTFEIWAVIYCL